MAGKIPEKRTLRATLCEVERGLFRVAYRMDGAGLGKHHLPLYQLGASPSEARTLVEHQVRELGYASVVWDDLLTDPPIPPVEPAPGLRLSA